MADPGQLSWFDPVATVLALRDSRYRHPANAIAELIDNSIDAGANRVDLLIKEEQEVVKTHRVWRVAELAVFDDGEGMDIETLAQALRFGGRKPSSRIQAIGKYGMGLPTASVSQCRRVDVWTWKTSIEASLHAYLDIAEIEREGGGDEKFMPSPQRMEIPEEWRTMIGNDTLDSRHGTLVVWKNVDRIKARASTIFDRIEQELGRIHRYFIDNGEIAVRMATFRNNKLHGEYREVRPNDPLFLMPNSATSEPWRNSAMFKVYKEDTYSFDVDERIEDVLITYSIVRPEALGRQRQTPGSLPHGKDALSNMGVSIVRESRELLLEDAFIREGGRGDQPMNRWWGAEIRFGKGCDDLFGVDHNKQMAEIISNAAKEIANTEANTDTALIQLEREDDQLYQMVNDIYHTTRSMFREIQVMYRQRILDDQTDSDSEDASDEAIRRASQITKSQLDSGELTPTPTDLEHEELSEEERTRDLINYLENERVTEPIERAEKIIRNDFRYEFIPNELDAYQMFSVRSRGGVLFVHLNIVHELYEFVSFLEERSDAWAHQAAIALRTLLLAWARMEDQTTNRDQRQDVQRTAQRWGEHATAILPQLSGEDAEDS